MEPTKFDVFLEQANIENEIKTHVRLVEVLVSKKKKTWTMHLEFDHVFQPAKLDEIYRLLKIYFLLPNIVKEIIVVPSFKTWDRLDVHADDLLKLCIDTSAKEHASIRALFNFKAEYSHENQTYTFLIDKDSVFVEKQFKILAKIFKAKGFDNIKFATRVLEELKPIQQVIVEDKQTQEAYLEQKKEMASQVKEPVKHKFDRSLKAALVPIKEIPVDRYHLDQYKNTKGDLAFSIAGEIGKLDIRELRTGSQLLTLHVYDDEDAIAVKRFLKADKDKAFGEQLKLGDLVNISGYAEYDEFMKSVVLSARTITLLEKTEKKTRKDKAKEKRVEFHIHTKMSNMDAVTDVKDYVQQAVAWGHDAIAFTDHNGVYAFPDIAKETKGKPIKPIYGVELDYIDDEAFKITSEQTEDRVLKEATYVVFDIETTGFSVTRDRIIEIGAVKVQQGSIIDRFQTFVNPKQPIWSHITELTQITEDMVKDAPDISEVLPQFLAFAKDSILVAHNALFDTRHIAENAKRLHLSFDDRYVIDSLNLARYFYSHLLKRFSLKALTKYFKVSNEQAHRAIHDAEATAQMWNKMLDDLYEKNIHTFHEINQAIDRSKAYQFGIPKHVNIIAQNQIGYKNMFKLVSDAQTTHFHQGTRALKSVINTYREGLLISSGCVNGEVFEAANNLSDEALDEAIAFYDIIEVQPPQAYRHLEKELGPEYETIIEGIISKIIRFAQKHNKKIIASGDVHYLNKSDMMYRDIYIHTPLVGGGIHPLFKYPNKPILYFMTTDEMLDAFAFLDEALAYQIVVTNTRDLSAMIDHIQAFPSELYSIPDDAYKEVLGIESIEAAMRPIIDTKMHELYGEKPHLWVIRRVEEELNSIIKNHFAPIYFTSHLLVKKSLEDGYLVGSRGSVGSSFIATLLDITEVNPLKPHYRCPNGDFTVFKMTEDELNETQATSLERSYQKHFENIQVGHDLASVTCPICGALLHKDGVDIPFETFLGFDGDKTPDIDLNFSGEYQAKAHAYVRELLGEDHTFRAGTIQTVAEKNAFGYVKGYLEDLGINMRPVQIERLAKHIEGVKRSSGQHPGGIVVVPKSKTIYDVTPIQYPAENTESEWKTTHFDYHSFESNLLKLDILGHDDPTMIKFLMDYVEKHPDEFPFHRAQEIPIDDPKVYELFAGTEILGVAPEDILSDVGSYGVPELGTKFVRQMLQETKPKTFAGLVKISGLSHGTDVWLKNARDLVMGESTFGKISFNDIIGCRDDIMVQLIEFGMPPAKAFEIMEFVRKGKPSKEKSKWLTYEKEMRGYHVPDWYIWSASKIKYLFPKAHATAYVTMAMRIAWFKVYKPLLFYSGFLSKRAVQFDYEVMVAGANAIRNSLKEILDKFNLTAKEDQLQVTLGIALEMVKRGYKFLPVDIEKSEAVVFKMEKDGLRMPFGSIDGLGSAVADDIVAERNKRAFRSRDDVKKRTKINKTVFEKMEKYGAFEHLAETSDVLEDGLFSLTDEI